MTTNRNSLWIREQFHCFDTPVMDYIDADGFISKMKWIPPFRAARALNANGAVMTPSGTAGDWFHPDEIGSLVLDTDYALHDMGGFWADMYLCSSNDAAMGSMGTVCDGNVGKKCYVSQALKSPRVTQNIAHFRTYLKARFDYGGFVGYGQDETNETWAGQGGLMTDAHWFEMWVWTRINRWLLRGNTWGYYTTNNIPGWHADHNDVGILDIAHAASNGYSVTGGGSRLWEVPVSDFAGNRWEFTDGLRLNTAGDPAVTTIYSAAKTVNPWTVATDGYSHADFSSIGVISGLTSGLSIGSYEIDADKAMHGIPASVVAAGEGGFDGQGWWIAYTDERVSFRGGNRLNGAQCPGALNVSHPPSTSNTAIGARAVLVP